MRRSKLFLALVFFALFNLTSVSSAWASEFSVGGVLGYQFELEAPLVGLDARYSINVAPSVDLVVQTQGNYFFLDSAEVLGATARSTVLQFDLDLLAKINLDIPLAPYGGAGPALVHSRSSVTSGDSTLSSTTNTDMGFNAIFGASLELGDIRPYGQLRVTFLDGTSVSLMLGLNFVVVQ